MNKFKQSVLAAAVGGLTAVGFVGSAQAGALGTSVLRLTDLTISDGVGVLDASDFTALSGNSTADTTASLASVAGSAGSSANVGAIPAVGIGLGIACQGGCIPGIAPAGSFPIKSSAAVPPDPSAHFAASDQLQAGAPITGIGPAVAGAEASHGAYVSLTKVDTGSAEANNGLNVSFNFAMGSGGSLIFAYDAEAYLEAFTNADAIFPTNASAAYSLIFTIDDLDAGTNVVTWAPNGGDDVGSRSAFGLMAETDPFSLNDGVSRNAPFNGASFRGAALGMANAGAFSATTVALEAGTNYQLAIRSSSEADASKVVPEPSVLALLGVGILGLGFIRRCKAS
ncbi:EDSAP-1 family PEP-CTERM protein [Nitrococcus mobilis]|nr:EDSAP-1 family PEP-CTERM protein [Nitrococcus mobilis]